MARPKITASALLVAYLLSGCAGTSMMRGSASPICQVSVVHAPARPVVSANVFSSAGSGAATGAASGALSGAAVGISGGLAGMVILAPFFGVVGAAAGAACGDWISKHPHAEPGFAAVARAADPDQLIHGLEAQLRTPRAGCVPLPAGGTSPATPDTLLEIEAVDYGMGCSTDAAVVYGIEVKWRARSARDGTLLRETMTRCHVTSSRPIDEWLADQDRARLEIERVLGRVGQRIAMQLTLPRDEVPGYDGCSFLFGASGEIE